MKIRKFIKKVENWVTLNESDIKLPTKNVDTQNESNNQVADDWYYAENGQSVGPFSEEQKRQFLRTNKIYGETYVYKKDCRIGFH